VGERRKLFTGLLYDLITFLLQNSARLRYTLQKLSVVAMRIDNQDCPSVSISFAEFVSWPRTFKIDIILLGTDGP
jgi:hypothetical protein